MGSGRQCRLGFDEVLEVFRRLETDFDFADRPWHGDAGPVPVRRYGLAERSVVADVFLEAACIDPDPTGADTLTNWARRYWVDVHPYTMGGAFVNFMMDEGEDRVRATYGDNYQRLAAVKATYDPANLFCVNQNIRTA